MCFLLIVLKLVNYSAKLFVKTSVVYKLMSADSVVIMTERSVSSQIYPLWSLQEFFNIEVYEQYCCICTVQMHTHE